MQEMKPKAFVLIAPLCATFLLVCSAAAAETSQEETKDVNAKQPEQYGGRCRYGCCGGWSRFGCQRCCKSADEAEATKHVNGGGRYGGGDGGGWGGGGHGGGHGGGGGGWGGGGHGGGHGGGGGGWGGGGHGGGYGGGGGGWGGGGHGGGHGGGGGGWGGGGHGGGRGGGGGGWGGGVNGGGGDGGKCGYGCCGGHGWNCKCCLNAEEAKAYVQKEKKP